MSYGYFLKTELQIGVATSTIYYYRTTVQSYVRLLNMFLQNLVVPIHACMYEVCIPSSSVKSRPVSRRVSNAACIHPDPYPLECLCPGDTADTSPMS